MAIDYWWEKMMPQLRKKQPKPLYYLMLEALFISKQSPGTAERKLAENENGFIHLYFPDMESVLSKNTISAKTFSF